MTIASSIPNGSTGPSTTADTPSPADLAERNAANRLATTLYGGRLEAFDSSSPASACLLPLLQAIGWRGEARHLVEALPHFSNELDLHDVRSVLANLNFNTRESQKTLDDLRDEHLPCLFSQGAANVIMIMERQGNVLTIFDGRTGEYRQVQADKTPGVIYEPEYDDPKARHEATNHPKKGWINRLIFQFRGLIAQLALVSFFINLTALAVPVFIMGVYDKVMGARAPDTLVYFVAGILLVIGAEMALRIVRSRALAYLGARIDALVGSATFQHLILMPISMTERAPVSTQLARLRQFESVREVFTGPIAGAILDIPFLVIFLGAVFWIAGPLGWIPVVLLMIFTIALLVTEPILRAVTEADMSSKSRQQSFLVELIAKQRMVKNCNGENVWRSRFREMSANTAMLNLRNGSIVSYTSIFAQTMMMLAGVATISMGTVRAMEGDMSIGALIATMALVWRVLAPLQSIFLSFNRLEQALESLRQINRMMRIPLERQPGVLPSFFRDFKGRISLRNISLRYAQGSEPALLGVNLDIKPGELIALTGSNGSGKSTVLKMLCGLYAPQAGSVMMDGLDIRQLDVSELRNAIGYAPQTATFFHGTIAQNLRLSHPTATDSDVKQALRDAGLEDVIADLPDGIHTRVTESDRRILTTGVRQRLNLARCYVKNSSVLLLDEPAFGLDPDADAILVEKLKALKGKRTVIMVTHRPSHMKLADKVVYMHEGRVLLADTPEEVIPKIFK